MSDLFNLHGRTALVTGANTGLGQAIAVALAEAGADIVAAGRSAADDTADRVRALGRRCLFLQADFGSTAPLQAVADAAIAFNGGIDILVNNAGTIRRADSLDVTEEDWDAVLNTNLRSVFFLSQALARHMAARGAGKIINVASLLSFQGGVRVPAYTASKSALAGMTRALANEWAALGINVNAIAPGYFETNNTTALREDAGRSAAILARIPAGRWGRPDDLAGIAVFLASRASDYVHGALMPVDGGWLAR
ncbi:2-dehydro-3-deoxy-D-gluconate 5-dehydrogenase KduD [Duganella violaceipulchra]|uniref:2-dehydro-3-deoxy-D-gluconate 5-dehydrogenase KduD n=1 Tax=Duganella violaceipulchra TaxID=2849652 RepID=A0AA41L0T9_9BURK|nr:2-dehydro-3-deoxy-D-gluconate 5-dehydrogenase KduD [Duganella violaceicalia]MBV6319468.1 2-dehydro-3-deoxy-D-gluconate 5-dehydrogenase KduD [Duganella violaceicalia]MCP2006721.1 2-deoxy-D-gluconate 3-dehydrogenase [Duganella violaceicalia]